MPLQISDLGQIPRIYKKLDSDLEDDAKGAIGKLEYTDLFRAAKSRLSEVNRIRIDMQYHFTRGTQTFSNIQAQVNGEDGDSTVAHVNVSQDSISTDDEPNQLGALKKVKKALRDSLYFGKSYEITGSTP